MKLAGPHPFTISAVGGTVPAGVWLLSFGIATVGGGGGAGGWGDLRGAVPGRYLTRPCSLTLYTQGGWQQTGDGAQHRTECAW